MNYTIRPMELGDAPGFNVLRRMPGVFETTLGLPSERVQHSIDGFQRFGPDDHIFVAVLEDGTVIGSAGLQVCTNPRMRHVGTLGMLVHTEFQNQGIGTALMKTVLELADNWLMLVRVELEVFADNARAIHLYEKFGFEKEALLRMSVVRDGQYRDNYRRADAARLCCAVPPSVLRPTGRGAYGAGGSGLSRWCFCLPQTPRLLRARWHRCARCIGQPPRPAPPGHLSYRYPLTWNFCQILCEKGCGYAV